MIDYWPLDYTLTTGPYVDYTLTTGRVFPRTEIKRKDQPEKNIYLFRSAILVRTLRVRVRRVGFRRRVRRRRSDIAIQLYLLSTIITP